MKKNRLMGLWTLFLPMFVCAQAIVPTVLITEVYGGGGNSGAVYNQDFVELYNPGTEAISLAGWSIQYYTSTGTTPSKTIAFEENLSIMPLQHFLVGASGGDVGISLPGKDLEVVAAFSLSSGKIILFKTNEKQTITGIDELLVNPVLVDFTPYGKSAVPVYGSAMEKDCSSTLSASRKKDANGNYIYTANIGSDFETISPNPVYSGLETQLSTINSNRYSVHASMLQIELDVANFVELYNGSGQVVFSSYVPAGSTNISLPRGVYLLKLGHELRKILIFEN